MSRVYTCKKCGARRCASLQEARQGCVACQRPADVIPDTVHPEFREWLHNIGAAHMKTPEQVWVLWRDYSRTCQAYDQSAIKSEFLEWYRLQLEAA